MDKNSALSEDIASVNLSEAVAERIFQGLTAETDFGIISVFKDGICIEENRLRSEHFEKDVERLRFGYNKIKGYCFAEGGAKALEDEFLIVYSLPERGEELKNFLKSACRQFSQNSLLFVADGEAFSWQPEKVKSVLGTFSRRELPRFLSMVRGKPFVLGDLPGAEGGDKAGTDEAGLSGCLLKSVPVKTAADSGSEFRSYYSLREQLLEHKDRYFESLHEEGRRCREADERYVEAVKSKYAETQRLVFGSETIWPVRRIVACEDFELSEEALSRFRKHCRQGAPMAIFASFAKPAQNGPDNGEKRILSEQEADKVFLNSVYALNYLGFALIRGDLFNPYERASKAWLGHCFIIYAIPLEGAGEFYDGMIEMRGLKAERGNSPVKTEAWLRRLAESFSGEYQLQPVVFINRQGGAKRICLKHTEITSRSEEGGERSAVIEDGGETALSGVKLHPKGDGVYIKIEDKPYACRFRLIGNSKIIAEESPGDYRGMFSGRVYYSNKFEEDYRRYFSRP